jgi:hypothetical protein
MNSALQGSHYTGTMWQPPTPWGAKLDEYDSRTSDDLDRVLGLGKYRKGPDTKRPLCLCGCLREVPNTMRTQYASTTCRRKMTTAKSRKAGRIQKGETFGEWTIQFEVAIRAANGGRRYQCRCSCGRVGVVLGTKLNRGDSLSCAKCQLEQAQERGRAVIQQQRAG